MIFVSVGTLHFRFDRLMRGLLSLPADQLVVQHGPAQPPPAVAEAAAFFSRDRLVELLDAADVVITHAGAGSILLASRAGHTPVVVPRMKRFGEHVDDHQLELAKALDAEGKVVAVLDVDELRSAVSKVPPRRPPNEVGGDRLQEAVRAAILG